MPRVQRHELDDAWCLAGFSRHGKFQAGSSLLQTSHVFEIFWAFWSEPRWSAACGPCLTLCYFSALTRVGRAGPSFLRSGIRFRTRLDTSLHHITPTCARERCMWATCVCAHGTSSIMQAARRVVLLRRCRGKQRWVRFVPHAFPILWCQHPVLSRERPPYNFRTLPVGPPSSCQSREMLSNDEWVGDPFALEKARGWCWQRSLILSASHIVHLVCATVALLFCESVAGPTDQHVKPTAPEACAFAPAPARPKSPMRGALGMHMHATYLCQVLFPESVWAQGSSNSGGLYLIFSSSHLLIFTPSHLHTFCHTFSSSHLLIFTSAHLHICSSSHLLIFTSAHLQIFSHICSSSHLLIFTSDHLHIFSHICSSSHPFIFRSSLTSAHLHICSSLHLLIFTSSLTSAHLHICSSSHLLSHLLIFTFSLTSAPLHTFSHTFSSSHLLSFLSPFSLSRLLYLSLFRPRVVPAGSHETWTLSHEMRVDRQKLRKNCDFTCAGATLSHEMRVDRQKLRKNYDLTCPGATFSHEMRVDRQKMRKNCDLTCPGATLSHEMRVDRQKLRKNCDFTCAGATFSHEMRVDRQKLRKNCDLTCPGATVSHEMRVDRQKLRKNCDFTCAGATLSHEMRVDRQKLRKNYDFTCAGATFSHEMRVDRQKLGKNCDFVCVCVKVFVCKSFCA